MTTEKDPIPITVRWGKLTPREREVARHLLDGLTYKEIAATLGIAYNTVNTHTKAIYEKFQVGSRGLLTALLVELRLPDAEQEKPPP